jgi:transglutaminase-like putative cysteine protease
MKLRVVHRTVYHYAEPATTSHHEARLTPRQSEVQRTITHELDVVPPPTTRRARLDYFGNRTNYLGLSEPHCRFEVTATSLVETSAAMLPDFSLTPAWDDVTRQLRSDLRSDVLQATEMRFASPLVPLLEPLRDFTSPHFHPGRPILEGVQGLMQQIHHDYVYDAAATDLSTPLASVIATRRGVCQDFAHVMIACLRTLGLAARYVSGYLRTHPPPGQPRLVGADASHAWVSVWLPDYGWVDFDPTNNLCPSEEHVTVAVGRDFSDVTPLRGVILGGGRHQLEVSVDVEAMS